MNNVELWVVSFMGALFLVEGGRRALGIPKRRHSFSTERPATPIPPPLNEPAEAPLGTVPTWVRQIVARLRQAAERIQDTTDRQNLLQGCDHLIELYERQTLNGMLSVNIPKLEARLNSLAALVERYVDIQDRPDLYLYDKSGEQLIAADSPDKLMADGSKAINGFANAVLIAIRDDNLGALQAYRVGTLVWGADSD